MRLHEVEKLLAFHGFALHRTARGDHRVYRHYDSGQRIVIALHRGACLGPGGVQRLKRELQASVRNREATEG